RYAQGIDYEARARMIEDFDIPFYVVLKDPQKNAQRLERVEHELINPWLASVGTDFYLHRNGNNIAVLPKSLNKAHAVRYLQKKLQEEYGEIMSLGMGDSKSDAQFMACCDYAIIPKQTQLAALTVEAL
ncbi:MAG: HAD hydrolase family protein, partial [Undibacterium sp.]|nr:HAD hydrolase family protein [Undibacterium sp.]